MGDVTPVLYGNHSRRTSVVPDVSYRRRNTMATLSVKQTTPIGSGTAEARFKKLSGLFQLGSTVQTKMLNMNSTKEEYITHQETFTCLQQDLKRIRGFLETLFEEYEKSKGLDPIRRHRRICSAIKKTVLYLRLMDVTNGMIISNGSERTSEESIRRSRQDSLANIALNGSVLSSETKSKEARKKFEEQASLLTNEELLKETKRIREQIRQYQRKIDACIETINEMESRYTQCKDHCFFLRYYFNKKIVKEIMGNREIFESI